MKNKKIISLATASVLSANMMPLNLITSYADEVTEEEQVQQEITVEQETLSKISTYDTTVRTLSANIKQSDEKCGILKGLDSNQIVLKTVYNNVTSDWKGSKGEIDAENSSQAQVFEIVAKSGYKLQIKANASILSFVKINYEDLGIDLYATKANVQVNPINSTSWSSFNKDYSGNIEINYKIKLDAKKITTEVIGNGTIIAPEELYYDNNEALIDKGTTHTFKINPGKNQEITATLDDEPLEVSEDNTVTIGAGHLKVEFTEAVETDKYELNLKVGSNGKVNIENQNFTGNAATKVSKEYETTLIAKPDNGYYTSKVTLDGKELSANEDGTYTLPTTELDARDLEVEFAEKMEATIVIDTLRLPYTGEEQELIYKVVGTDDEEITTGKAVFTKKNLIGQTTYNPVEIGNHNFKATFAGNEKYRPCTLEGTLEIYDNREEVTIELVETSKVYNGEVQTIEANVLNSKGEVVGQADVTYDFKAEHLLNPAGKDVGTYDVTAKFKGDKNYRPAELKGTIEITKCKPKVSVGSKTSTYTGEPIRSDVKITPNCGYIGLYTGVNTKLTPVVYVDLNLGDDAISKTICDLINSMEISTAGDLKKIFENETLIKLLEAAKIDVSDVINALKYLPNDMALSFGAPVNAGAYVSTAVVLDKNAEVTVGVGALLVTKTNRNIVFTEDSLSSGGKVKPGQDYKISAIVEGTKEEVEVKFTGLTSKGKTYSSTTAPKEVGAYVATAYLSSNSNYRADIAVRRFTIAKSTSSIEITSTNNKVYDGNAYKVEAVVKDRDGNTVNNATVKYTYYKGLKKLSDAPTEVGSYRVVANYSGDDGHYGSSTSMKFDISKQ